MPPEPSASHNQGQSGQISVRPHHNHAIWWESVKYTRFVRMQRSHAAYTINNAQPWGQALSNVHQLFSLGVTSCRLGDTVCHPIQDEMKNKTETKPKKNSNSSSLNQAGSNRFKLLKATNAI
jgi:hypothetical protein